jgi:nickel-dependent lactate racemase
VASADSIVRFHYGPETVEVAIPTRNLASPPALRTAPAVPDLGACLAAALSKPIGAPPLRELARAAKRVAIVVPDYTRDTPTAAMLPPVLAELDAAGVEPDAVSIVGATGTHRPMSEAQLARAVGQDVVRAYRVASHDAKDAANLVRVGTSPAGTPIWLNRAVAEADLVVAVGSVKPHFNYGWSGGAKAILPGVSGWDTIGPAHWFNASYCDTTTIGTVDNYMRQEGEAVAEAAGLRYILNSVPNARGETMAAVAGDFRQSWRHGVELARAGNEFDFDYFRANPSQRVDVIVAGTRGVNMFHGGASGIIAADQMLRNSGEVVQFCPCSDGIAVEHPEVAEFGYRSYGETRKLVESGAIRNLTGATLMVNLGDIIARRSATVRLYAHHQSREQIARLNLLPAASPQAAVDAALAACGADARVFTFGRVA